LDLQKRDWTIHANDPDLDTVLAIWVLLNHMRLSDADAEIRRKAMLWCALKAPSTLTDSGNAGNLCVSPQQQASVFAELSGYGATKSP
jgi:hypothetical protein